jgi:hypothetical protein
MEHDDRCNAQDTGLALLREAVRHNDATLVEVVARVQKLVDQYNDANLKLGTLCTKHDALHRDFTALRGQVYTVLMAFILGFVGVVVTWITKGGLTR